MNPTTTTTRRAAAPGSDSTLALSWTPAADGRTHLMPTQHGMRSGHAVCGALVEISPLSVAAAVCLGCRAAALTDPEEAPTVPRCEARRYRRRLHARHQWLVTRCRLVGSAR